MAELLHDQVGGIGVECLRNGRHHAELHQRLDHLAGSRGHTVGQLLDSDRVGQDHVAHDLHLVGPQALEFGLPSLALALTPHRRERTDAFVLALDGCLDVNAAGTTACVGPFFGDDGLGFARGDDAAGATGRTRLVLVIGATRARP